MTDNEIIKAASLPMYRQFAVAVDGQGNLIRVRDLIDVINRLNAKNDELFYKLEGVMHSVDKWLEGDELKQDEVNRAATMREKTLRIVEEQQAEIERYKGVIKILEKDVKTAKSEAIKEFVERLKCNASILCDKVTSLPCSYTISNYNVNRLVKEMTEL